MHIRLHIFSCGTTEILSEDSKSFGNPNSIVRIFFNADAAPEIPVHTPGAIDSFISSCTTQDTRQPSHATFKIGFSGCDIEYWKLGPFTGAFAFGIAEQSDIVFDIVSRLIANGHHISLVCFGYSRGAITSLLIAKKLRLFQRNLHIHLLLCDPVPGNLRLTLSFGLPAISNDVLDLSMVSRLSSATVLFVRKSGPPFGFTPLIPRWPAHLSYIRYIVLPSDHPNGFVSFYRKQFFHLFNPNLCEKPNPFLMKNLENLSYYFDPTHNYTAYDMESLFSSGLAFLIILNVLEDFEFDFSHSHRLKTAFEVLILDFWRTENHTEPMQRKVARHAAKKKRIVRIYQMYEMFKDYLLKMGIDNYTRVTHSTEKLKILTDSINLHEHTAINLHHFYLSRTYHHLLDAFEQKYYCPKRLLLKVST